MGRGLRFICPECGILWGRHPVDDRVAYYQVREEDEEPYWTMNVPNQFCPDCKKRGSRK